VPRHVPLLVDYRTCVGVRIDVEGRGTRTLELREQRGTKLDVQYIGWSRTARGYEASNGLEIVSGR
jgi:hypothetical protein